MTAHATAHVVLLTPPGRSAVASLLVEGPRATEIVAADLQTLCAGSLEGRALDHIVVGHWQTVTGEELVVCRRTAEQIEIHCHGGSAAVAAIIEGLVTAGCRQLPWAEWMQRREADPIRVQARMALANVRTLRAAAILLDQFAGALRRELLRIHGALRAGDFCQASELLQGMRKYARIGMHLVEPWRVVLAGPRNAGKSSLLNALVGFRRAIVFDQAGTTRDVVTTMTALDGWPIELADTAGLGESTDAVELAGLARTHEQLAAADTVVLVFDATEHDSVDHQRLRETWPDAICVYNKCDLLSGHAQAIGAAHPESSKDMVRWPTPFEDSGRATQGLAQVHGTRSRKSAGPICTSAVAGVGIDELAAAVAKRLVPDPPPPGAAVPFLPEHVQAIERALSDIEQLDPTAALRRITDITTW